MRMTALFLAVMSAASVAWGESRHVQHKGACALQEDDGFKAEKHVRIAFGEGVTFECGAFATEMMGEYRVRAQPVIKNTTEAKVKVWYFLAFFDGEGNLIACNADSREIETAGEATLSYSAGLDKAKLGEVAGFQATMFIRSLTEWSHDLSSGNRAKRDNQAEGPPEGRSRAKSRTTNGRRCPQGGSPRG